MGVMWPGPDFDHSPPSSAKVKNEWRYTYIPPTYLQNMEGDNLSFTHLFRKVV
jgi:hypothetical protein